MPEAEYIDALLSEITFRANEEEWQDRSISTIFFGGGTPSLFKPSSIARILDFLQSKFGFMPEIETTLEANPGTIQEQLGLDSLKGFRTAGVNRISMGVQSFRTQKLKFLGRLHSAEDAERAVQNVRAAGFENFNLDLIFGVADETVEEWFHDLSKAIDLNPLHISAYGLTIESGTEFGRRAKKGTLPLAEESLQAELQLLTAECLQKATYKRYEISNFAKANAQCRHNLAYWQGVDYLGLGAGAHSYLAASTSAPNQEVGHRWSNIPKPEHYIERASKQGDASQRKESIDLSQSELEFFFTRLRMSSGISTKEYLELFNRSFETTYFDAIKKLKLEGLIENDQALLRLTSQGFIFADYVLAEFAKASSL